jgi:hypothetical protein
MNCPKCNHEQKEENTECKKCGIIFAKYNSWLNSKSRNTPASSNDTEHTSQGDLFFYSKPDENILSFYGRLVVLIGLIFWGFKFMISPIESNYAGESYMHLVNLPFHEAGHVFFRPFGSFITSLGGTLGQLIMPLICASVLLLKTRDPFGASVTLWWFGQNFFDIAPYINDARSLSMPLVGGNFGYSSPYGFHDWEYLLTESGLLQQDHFIAKSSVTIGSIIFIISFAWGGTILYKQYKNRT